MNSYLHFSPFFFWTAHKVQRSNVALGTRYSTPLPVDNYISNDLYCIVVVYVDEKMHLQWEPKECSDLMGFACNVAVSKSK